LGFLQDLTGSSAKKALKQGKAASDAALQAGYDQATPFYNQAKALYQPYADAGGKANQLYADTLGVNGADAQATGENTYFNDPVQQRILQQKTNALLTQQNARGNTYNARGLLAGQRVGLENYQGWQQQLAGLGNQGLQATGQIAGITSGQGDLRYSLGAAQAGQETNYANARAQASQLGVNNLLGGLGVAAKAYGAFSGAPIR
jgi:hypothetical protein